MRRCAIVALWIALLTTSTQPSFSAESEEDPIEQGLNFLGRDLNEPKHKFWMGNGKMLRRTITADGVKRMYYVYLPVRHKKAPAPTVLMFHGGGGTPWGMDKIVGGFSLVADREGFVIVYPEGLRRCWNDTRDSSRNGGVSDLTFASKLIDSLVKERVADPKRVYAAGMSNGGFFSQYLGLQIPGKLAAIASVVATVASDHLKMVSGKPVPILFFLGTSDPLVMYDGGPVGTASGKEIGTSVSAKKSIEYWVKNNRTSKTATVRQLPDRDPKDRTRVTAFEYSNGKSRSDVVLYQVKGGGHVWPGGEQYVPEQLVGRASRDINANEVIWSFFKKHRLPQDP